jgi:hypothetical protein
MHRNRNVLTVRDVRIPFQPIRSPYQQEALVMRDSVDMDDIAAQGAARIFVRTVTFSYTMYYMSVPVVGCDRSCHLGCFPNFCTIRSNIYQQPYCVYSVPKIWDGGFYPWGEKLYPPSETPPFQIFPKKPCSH